MLGYRFSNYTPPPDKGKSDFDKLLKVFMQLILVTSGDVAEALQWLTEVDRQYGLTNGQYGIGDFIEDLKRKGYITEEGPKGEFKLKAKSEQSLRQSALEEIFGKLKKTKSGEHNTHHSGRGDEQTTERRDYEFGDTLEQISVTDSLRNAQINHGLDNFMMTEDDLEVMESEFKAQTSTVLMIDISHSMILYGEDRITPAKKVAMALAELITKKYPKDTLDILVFGDDAWQIEIKDLPYLQVGPYHTNTVAGLELAMDILRRRKNANKQIFMITDGKPSALFENGRLYTNSFGLDMKIVNRTLEEADRCRRAGIPITTFMLATDPMLVNFVDQLSKINRGRAFYASADRLGEYILADYIRNRRKFVH
jgi:uncharacterized protein with von Willebrand factor type A (vWA) domain